MQDSYLSEAKRFFRETDQEIDPDSAVFIKFFKDPSFWIWFGGEIRLLIHQCGDQDLTARPTLDRYLHGLICADRYLGGNGAVIQSMKEVLTHTPEILSGWVCLPELSLKKSLDEDIGPHSKFASSRLLTYLWATFGENAADMLEAFTGHLGDDLKPLVISAALGSPSCPKIITDSSEADLRKGLVVRLLTAVQSSSLPGGDSITAQQAFSGAVHANIGRDGYLAWPEWQLLPLLTGGIEYAREHCIDLVQVSKYEPVGGRDISIWTAAFMVGHAASSEALHRYFCDVLLPTGDPAEIMKNVWSMGTAMGKWAPRYIEKHREVFFATPSPSQSSLESLIGHGVPKRTVMSHPGFSRQAKGRILSDDLGM